MAPFWGRKIDNQVWGLFSYANYVDLRDQNRTFSGLCAWSEISAGISSGESRDVGEGERAEVLWGELVTANYFEVMGVKPFRGREFCPDKDTPPGKTPRPRKGWTPITSK